MSDDLSMACDVCGATQTTKGVLFSPQTLGMHRYHHHQIRSEVRKHKRKPKALGPITPEDVVIVVLEQMFPQGIPVAKIGAVLRWQDATIQFMKEMS